MSRRHLHRGVGLLLLAAARLSTGQELLLDTPAIQLSRDGPGLALRLATDLPPQVDVARVDGGVLLGFPHPFDASALEGFPAVAPDWLQDLRYGYDSIFLVPLPDVTLQVEQQAGAVLLRLRRQPETAAAPSLAAGDDGSSLRLARLDALLRHRSGDSDGARARLRALMEGHPEDVQSVIDLIEVNRGLGRWRDALALYDRALTLAPGAAFLVQGKASLLAGHGQSVEYSHRLVRVRNADRQQRSTARARLFAGHGLVVGAEVERRTLRAPAVLNPISGLSAAQRLERLRSSLYLDVPGPGPLESRAWFHAAASGPGTGLDLGLGWDGGHTLVQMHWREPYWEFVEGISHGGRRDRLRIAHRLPADERFAAAFEVAINRYALDEVGRVAIGTEVHADLRYTVQRSEPFIGLGYHLDTERFGASLGRDSAAGQRFRPIRFVDSEIHQFDLTLSERLTDYVQLSASGGYSVDRLADRGPFWSVALDYVPLPGFEAGLGYGYAKTSSSGSGGATTTLGGHLRVRF